MSETSDNDNDLNLIKNEKEKVELIRGKWKGRRRMAWTALINILVIVYSVMFFMAEHKIAAAQEVLVWAFIILGSVILGYMGFTTVAETLSKRK